MLTFSSFSGINNVLPSERLTPDPKTGVTPLAKALNVDIGLTGELRRRQGYSLLAEGCHKNLHQGHSFLLATLDGDLVNLDGPTLYPSLGSTRVWYCDLPDGRITFSNGLICGITDGEAITPWGVPMPDSLGTLEDIPGELFPGDYRYQLTHVRVSDGLEGGPLYSMPAPISEGGVFLSGLPVLDGYKTNVYLNNGEAAYLAGSTTNGLFSYTGPNSALVLPCWTEMLSPAPPGTVSAFWRGRVLVAQGSVLYASVANRWESFDLRRDFKQLGDTITGIVPVEGGIFVGTEKRLLFLVGTEWDKLLLLPAIVGRTVPGSMVRVPGEYLRGDAPVGAAMVGIADGGMVAGFADGTVVRLAESYRTEVSEVAATFRLRDGIPQYVAIPQ